MIRVTAYLTDHHLGPGGLAGPGRPTEVDLDATVTGPAELSLAGLTVRDERGGDLFRRPGEHGYLFDPAAGGGPLAGPEAQYQARGFGVTNTAYHAARVLDLAARLLDRPLPPLVIRIGPHSVPGRGWGGGHYRLPGEASPPEPEPPARSGEIHLGAGRRFTERPDPGCSRYFHAPAHNPAIIYHEVGHHICHHTADFRANRLRPPLDQHNGKVALDEGTADFLAAVLLGTPDIYGWHRGLIPPWDPRRRQLDARWTTACMCPGNGRAHANGTVWASALWTAHERVRQAGGAGITRTLLTAMTRFGSHGADAAEEQQRRNRFSELLRELLAADPAIAPVVAGAMADHGILPYGRNWELRARMQARAASPDAQTTAPGTSETGRWPRTAAVRP
ncbi:hypothetical protein OG369_33010 [Streptomyces sp. NBC_01221]|uniref:hypothetical protein n=1 Tax=unclassified Streptomyces TaxID=2593676 RepID=UPI002254A546|nr:MULTISPECIES: hypothetical protein [unclassified Streptomyces]MCX4790806.1 hypothetical protein [Streptomyces sp. NBC_01221]WSJ34898.1 hypothetical protein OG772_01680 [Streptomyces sp. NBC_01321]WSP59067.1 hypothetical protein OG306_35325 [Streptomyces sp. NBC_01241]WSU20411.1 hypothetical protein OG508_04990 [Streptomyces sp. NBC_01108]